MTDLPVPAQEDPTAPPNLPAPIPPQADRLISLYLRTLTSPQTIRTYNTEIRMFVAYAVGELGKELSELTAEDVSLYREHLINGYASATAAKKLVMLRVFGKGDKIRNVPISPDLWRLVQRYVLLSGRSLNSHTDARKPLLTSRVGKDKPLTTRSVQNIVKKYVRAAGITKPISPHSIRHTVGTNMAVNEAPLLVIQQFLGHSDPKTTLRY